MSSPDETRETYTTDSIAYDVEKIAIFENRAIDAMVTALVALGSEVWTTQRRVKIMESVLQNQGVSMDLVDQYQPTPEEEAEWRGQRDQFIKRVYGALEQGGEAKTDYGPDLEKLRRGG